MDIPKAEYKCMKCKKVWKGELGPTSCKMCGHLYVWWMNAKEIMEIIHYPCKYYFDKPEEF